jgi:hypothetical protein
VPQVAVTAVHQPISARQNSDESMELLRADTWYYLRAKRWHALKVTGTLVLALAAPLVLFGEPGWGDWLGALAGAWVLAGRTVLSWLDERHVHRAVTIQEEFDVDLFDLDWNEGLAGPKAAPEDIHDAARRIHKDKQLKKLRHWYADTDSAPWPLNVVLCQRSSAVWGRRNHFWYAYLVLSLGIAWFIAGLVMASVAHASLTGYLVTVFLPSQPAFLDTVDLFRGHFRLAKAKEALENQTTVMWNKGVHSPGSVTEQDCREVQDQAYRLRRSGMQVPQLVYQLRRKQDEAAMRAAAARLRKALPRDSATSAE